IDGQLLSENGKLSYQLATQLDNKTIRFTTDESEPNMLSDSYNSPIKIQKNTIIKAAVFDNEMQLGKTFTQQLNYHKAVGKSITLSVEPHKTYNTGGKEALINSINGSNTRFGDKEWLGFYGDDVTITIDLGKEMQINSIETRFFNANGQWIYTPSEVEIYVDNRLLTNAVIKTENLMATLNEKMATNAQVIQLKIKNYGII